MRILQIHHPKYLKRLMQDIKVDAYGIKIMVPKAMNYLIKINSLSNIAANILKQEMLSLGGDVAIARDALTGKTKKTDCLLIGSLSELSRLSVKLRQQPFSLNKVALDLSHTLSDYEKKNFVLNLGRHKLILKDGHSCIMGIVNLTPDSFSGDGFYRSTVDRRPSTTSEIVEFIEKMVSEGADIIDLGAESTRPEARPITVREELKRTIPVIKRITKKIKVPISIDTSKPEVAKQALDNGVEIVNDITGLRNPEMTKVVSRYKAALVIMHMKGKPRSMQKDPKYNSLIDEIIEFLTQAIRHAEAAGIDKEKIIVDPGIGFGKTAEHNLEILKNLREFKILGQPLLVGPSRKSFIGKILGVSPQERIFGTIASCIQAASNGANIVRVHDVKAVKQALKVSDSINNI
ncbi:MAG: dihydropteroate synthase [Candidatus Omnitrophica bacterium]|nr:dihydropteroate synthase [Candidatus Omnitrophota bacterium]